MRDVWMQDSYKWLGLCNGCVPGVREMEMVEVVEEYRSGTASLISMLCRRVTKRAMGVTNCRILGEIRLVLLMVS